MKKVLIIGLGEFGKHLAHRLTALRNDVCIIDSNKEKTDAVSGIFDNVYTGDCMNIETLKELGVKDFDFCVVAIGENFQASLEITSNLKECGAKYIISKAASEIQSKFLKMAGADEAIYPEKDIAEKVAIRCNTENLIDFIAINESVGIYEVAISKDWIGKNLITLNIRKKYNINVIAVESNGVVSVPNVEHMFEADDKVFILGDKPTIDKFLKSRK